MEPQDQANRCNRVVMWGGIILVCIILAVAAARAGELGFRWTEQDYPFPLSYELTVGGEVVATLLPGDPFVLQGVPDDCQVRAYEFRTVAHLPGGELLKSEPVLLSSMARPVITGVVLGPTGVYRVEGDNFPPDATVAVNNEPVNGVVRETCQVLTFPTTTGTPATVLVNAGGLLVTWTLPAPLAPQNVEFF